MSCKNSRIFLYGFLNFKENIYFICCLFKRKTHSFFCCNFLSPPRLVSLIKPDKPSHLLFIARPGLSDHFSGRRGHHGVTQLQSRPYPPKNSIKGRWNCANQLATLTASSHFHLSFDHPASVPAFL